MLANYNGGKHASLSFSPKEWDSDFFGRKILQMSLQGPIVQGELTAALSKLDQQHVWGIEVHLSPEQMGNTMILEDAGFRLVDSRMSFISRLKASELDERTVPFGRLRQVDIEDLERVSQLTTMGLIDNPAVYSRFKNPYLFSREESIRYYDAWNNKSFSEHPELFVVWEIEGDVVAYSNFMRFRHSEFDPLYKGILTVVEAGFRGHNAHNIMQSFLYKRFGKPEWWVDNTTQVSNTAVLRSHIKAGKKFHGSNLIFYRAERITG